MRKKVKVKAEVKDSKKAVIPRRQHTSTAYAKILAKAGELAVGKTLRLSLPEDVELRVFINRLGVALRYACIKGKVAIEKGHRFALFGTDDLKHVAISKVLAKKKKKRPIVQEKLLSGEKIDFKQKAAVSK